MVDKVSSEIRSRMMASVKSRNTKPEIQIRHMLHRMGFRYRLHVNNLAGKPDIVFPKYRAVIQVNGCFWHAHGCAKSKLPKTRVEFWQKKIEKNKERDKMNIDKLINQGWRVLVWWECNTKNSEKFKIALGKAAEWLLTNEPYLEID
ncbi:very short patch repair endonuclease [Acinetobacter baumannii]|uniref:very short patch repair endonuclease n=1 Tax=Acinetobacter baumannii TaxID=470 RepID=UPI0029DAF38D|nr:very short patch repair endonuclease [Acinetobacter baumannii]MDX7907147.1 very short patch repair endonuclease [Acinetobacter baumannii]MDX7927377.1 very short patch repair endonuclease [Acinetobacter baumannii]